MKRSLKDYAVKLVVVGLAISGLAWYRIFPTAFKIFWEKNPLGAHIIREHTEVHERAKIATLRSMTPYVPYLSDIVAGKEKPEGKFFGGYYSGESYDFFPYYRKAAEFFPNNDAAQALAGFCEYYQGNKDKAVSYYEQSLQADPYFFWTYYNLGVLYFEKKDFIKSALFLEKALAVKQEVTLKIIRSSDFYIQIWRRLDPFARVLEKNLEEGRQDAALLLAVSFLEMRQPQKAVAVVRLVGGPFTRHQDIWKACLTVVVAGPEKYLQAMFVLNKILEKGPFHVRIF